MRNKSKAFTYFLLLSPLIFLLLSLRFYKTRTFLTFLPLFFLMVVAFFLERRRENKLTQEKGMYFLSLSPLFASLLLAPLYISLIFYFLAYFLASLFKAKSLPEMESLGEDVFTATLTRGTFLFLFPLLNSFSLAAFISLLFFFLFKLFLLSVESLFESDGALKYFYRSHLSFSGKELAVSLLLGYWFSLLFKSGSWGAILVFLLFIPFVFLEKRLRGVENLENSLFRVIFKLTSEEREKIERITKLVRLVGISMGIYGKSLEDLVKSSLLQDFAFSGVDEYSLDYMLEKEGSREEGMPLHAKLAGESFLGVEGFEEIGENILKHHRPFFHHKKRVDEWGKIPLGARIIYAVSSYESLVSGDREESLKPAEAWRSLKKDQGFLYDPKVLRHLRRVLIREGAFSA